MDLQPPTTQQEKVTTGSTIRPKTSRFLALWRESHRQAAKDFRARWQRCGMWGLIIMWFLVLILSLIVLVLVNTDFQGDDACLPDGSFSVDPSTYRYFSRSGFFEITLAFGTMTFTQAKVIDVAWDILVGRGGQSLLAYISWRVFANYVTTSMEVMPITFRTYRTIFLQNGSLLVGIPRLIRDFCSRHALHSRLAMVFMVYAMALSLAFPTLVSSLTGYKGKVDAFVMTAQGNYVPFDSFDYASYIIHDGGRLEGFYDNYIVLASGLKRDLAGVFQPTVKDGDLTVEVCSSVWNRNSGTCSVVTNVTEYVKKYGLYGENNVTSTLMGQELSPPALNISAFSVPLSWRAGINTQNFSMQSVSMQGVSMRNLSMPTFSMQWAYENTTYTQSYMTQNGKCQPNLAYQWGISFIQAFITVILLLIWSTGIYFMWLRTHSIMKRRGRTEVAGEHKAVLELAHAMQKQQAGLILPSKEQNEQDEKDSVSATTTAVVVPVTEATLHHRISKELRGGSIAYAAPLLANGETTDPWTLLGWIKSHKWSVAIFVSAFILSFFSGFLLKSNVVVTTPLAIEVAIALYMGSTPASRIVIFFWTFLLVSLVPQIVLSAMHETLY